MGIAWDARDLKYRLVNGREAGDGSLATFYEHVETDDYESDRCKGYCENREAARSSRKK